MGSSVRCIVIVDPSANESFRGIKRFEYELFGGKKIRRFVDSDGIEFGV